MTTFLTVAYASFIAWAARWPSDWLFEEALTYYAAAERWDAMRLQCTVSLSQHGDFARRRDECFAEGERLARKAIRRMPWRLV